MGLLTSILQFQKPLSIPVIQICKILMKSQSPPTHSGQSNLSFKIKITGRSAAEESFLFNELISRDKNSQTNDPSEQEKQ